MTGKIHIIVIRQEFDISVSHLYKWALRVVERCVLILALPLIKLFAWGRGEWRTCATRDDEPRPVWTRLPLWLPITH